MNNCRQIGACYYPILYILGMIIQVIAVTPAEKVAVQERFPKVKFVRTMKQDSKRHHYYMEEQFAPMRYLMVLRGLEKPRQPKQHDKRRRK